jgi:hypothetical protein
MIKIEIIMVRRGLILEVEQRRADNCGKETKEVMHPQNT